MLKCKAATGVFFSVIACGLTTNLAFSICLHFKFPEFADFYDCSDMKELQFFSYKELHSSLFSVHKHLLTYTRTLFIKN